MQRQALWLEAIERRIAATSAMLDSMKGVKMGGLTDVLREDLQRLRVEEMENSKGFRKLMIWTMMICQYIYSCCIAPTDYSKPTFHRSYPPSSPSLCSPYSQRRAMGQAHLTQQRFLRPCHSSLFFPSPSAHSSWRCRRSWVVWGRSRGYRSSCPWKREPRGASFHRFMGVFHQATSVSTRILIRTRRCRRKIAYPSSCTR